MPLYSPRLRRILDAWPGKRLGMYRFMPLFFVIGAAIEYSMINWQVGETSFCKYMAVYFKAQFNRIPTFRENLEMLRNQISNF